MTRNVATRGGGLFLLLLQALLLTLSQLSSLSRSSRFRLILGIVRIGAVFTISTRSIVEVEPTRFLPLAAAFVFALSLALAFALAFTFAFAFVST